jgi:hypothetical protein
MATDSAASDRSKFSLFKPSPPLAALTRLTQASNGAMPEHPARIADQGETLEYFRETRRHRRRNPRQFR